eukprot:jgi/Chrzof1/2932/Cz12g04140.t1
MPPGKASGRGGLKATHSQLKKHSSQGQRLKGSQRKKAAAQSLIAAIGGHTVAALLDATQQDLQDSLKRTSVQPSKQQHHPHSSLCGMEQSAVHVAFASHDLAHQHTDAAYQPISRAAKPDSKAQPDVKQLLASWTL